MQNKLIYVVEDDYQWAQWTITRLKEELGESIEVEHITSHHGFLERIEEIRRRRPACLIVDVMLPWTDTQVSEEPDSMDSFVTAGIDCVKKLRAGGDAATMTIPILIYTLLDRSDLTTIPDGVEYVRKDADYRMIAWVKKALSRS